MDDPSVNEVHILIERLQKASDLAEDSSMKLLLTDAWQALEALSDFSVNLVSAEGETILTISDEKAREIMFKAIDTFVQSMTIQGDADVPEHMVHRGIPDLDIAQPGDTDGPL